jgi:hypothetical protein
VQGMNEVLAPLYYVFKTDVDEANAVRTISLINLRIFRTDLRKLSVFQYLL